MYLLASWTHGWLPSIQTSIVVCHALQINHITHSPTWRSCRHVLHRRAATGRVVTGGRAETGTVGSGCVGGRCVVQ